MGLTKRPPYAWVASVLACAAMALGTVALFSAAPQSSADPVDTGNYVDPGLAAIPFT